MARTKNSRDHAQNSKALRKALEELIVSARVNAGSVAELTTALKSQAGTTTYQTECYQRYARDLFNAAKTAEDQILDLIRSNQMDAK